MDQEREKLNVLYI